MSAMPQPQKQARQGPTKLTDVKTLREQARRHVEEGAVTENYGANKEKVIELLNEALAIDPAKDPSNQLVTLVQQRRARALLDQIDTRIPK